MHNEEIEIRELLQILWHRKWLILGITVIFAVASILYTAFLITPLYDAETTLMVQGSKGVDAGDLMSSFDLGSITMSQKLVVTYGEIVKSRIVLEQVIDRLGLQMTYKGLLNSIQSSPVGSTEILRIKVTADEPEKASLIANTISDVFIKEVIRILRVNNVEIIDKAIPQQDPINVKMLLNTAIATVLGLMLSAFIAFGLEYLDATLKTEQDVAKYLGLPLVGAIPEFNLTAEESQKP